MVERFLGKEEVIGSIPIVGSIRSLLGVPADMNWVGKSPFLIGQKLEGSGDQFFLVLIR